MHSGTATSELWSSGPCQSPGYTAQSSPAMMHKCRPSCPAISLPPTVYLSVRPLPRQPSCREERDGWQANALYGSTRGVTTSPRDAQRACDPAGDGPEPSDHCPVPHVGSGPGPDRDPPTAGGRAAAADRDHPGTAAPAANRLLRGTRPRRRGAVAAGRGGRHRHLAAVARARLSGHAVRGLACSRTAGAPAPTGAGAGGTGAWGRRAGRLWRCQVDARSGDRGPAPDLGVCEGAGVEPAARRGVCR